MQLPLEKMCTSWNFPSTINSLTQVSYWVILVLVIGFAMSSPISIKRPSCLSVAAQRTLRLSNCFGALVLLTASTGLAAQDVFEPDGALSFKLGETDVYPSVRIDYLQNSNAFLTPSNPTEAADITISPELNWVADRRLVTLLGTYSGNYNSSSEEALNYADHTLSFTADAELSSRKHVDATLSLNFGHEDLGLELTRGNADENSELVQFTNIEGLASFRYGADQARGNVTAGLNLQDFGYNSRRDVSAGRGFSLFEPFAAFSYRLGGDTRAVAELRFATVNFDNKDRDRTDLTLLGGMNFAATGKTGGNFRVGLVQSQPDLASLNSQTELVLESVLFWEPTSFSRFTLSGTRTLDNEGSSLVSTDAVSAISNRFRLSWRHEWSSRLSHTAFVQSFMLEQACPNRNSDRVLGSIEFNLQIRRWISVGVSGRGWNGEYADCPGVTNQELDFERTRFGAFIRATL